MSIQVSICYYHPNRETAATCSQCGVGICKRCTVIDDSGRAICYKCGNENLKLEHKEYRRELKQEGGHFCKGSDFIIPGIIGILIIIAYFVLGYFAKEFRMPDLGSGIFGQIMGYIMISYVLFSIPFGVIMLNDLFADRYMDSYVRSYLIFLKYFFAVIIGWICFTFYWLRFVILKIFHKI